MSPNVDPAWLAIPKTKSLRGALAPKGATMKCDEMYIPDTFDARIYNSLMDLGEANTNFKKASEMDQFFHDAGTLILDHKLEDYVGLCLLHKHNLVEDGELMIEQFETVDEQPALVMSLQPQDAPFSKWPAVWKLGSDQQSFSPVEYSTTETARAGHERLMAAIDFFRGFRSLLTHYGYENLLGAAIRRSGELKRSEDESIVERCHPTRVANVLTSEEVSPEDEPGMIRTNWSFERGYGAQTAAQCVEVKCEQRCQPTGTGQPHLESHQSGGHRKE